MAHLDDPRLPGPDPQVVDASAFASALNDSESAVAQYQADAAAFQGGVGEVGEFADGEGNL